MPGQKQPAIYILASKPYGTLYTGVTSDLVKRIYEHKSKAVTGFSARYDCDRLVYFEVFDDNGKCHSAREASQRRFQKEKNGFNKIRQSRLGGSL